MLSVLDVARYFAGLYREGHGEAIGQMKLLKLVYLAQRESLVRTSCPLFPEKIFAYQYGPVMKEVLRFWRAGEAESCTLPFVQEDSDRKAMNHVYETYSDKDAWSLSRLTHAETSWIKARRRNTSGGGDRLMPVEDIEIDANSVRMRRLLKKRVSA